MDPCKLTRRTFLGAGTAGTLLSIAETGPSAGKAHAATDTDGTQRLSLASLKKWESLGYGMFIHYGMSTYVGQELPDGNADPSVYAPDALDVDQWASVIRDAGMRYAVLTTKHVAGHCLWPTAHTGYSVKNSGNTTDVVGKFVEACRSRDILPGFYYCSWDNHNRFGSKTPSDPDSDLPAYTTSLYQNFQTAQVSELLTQYGPIAETWIDIPGVLGRGYRSFLYDRIASLQPDTVVMMNSGISTGEQYDMAYAWPSDLIAIERRLPPDQGHNPWRDIEGKRYYMPGEVCDPIGKDWFFVEGDAPRSDKELAEQYQACRARGVNFLLDVPPDPHGRIPDMHVRALIRLAKNVGL